MTIKLWVSGKKWVLGHIKVAQMLLALLMMLQCTISQHSSQGSCQGHWQVCSQSTKSLKAASRCSHCLDRSWFGNHSISSLLFAVWWCSFGPGPSTHIGTVFRQMWSSWDECQPLHVQSYGPKLWFSKTRCRTLTHLGSILEPSDPFALLTCSVLTVSATTHWQKSYWFKMCHWWL